MKLESAILLLCLGAPCWAQQGVPPDTSRPVTAIAEPQVRHTVIEDAGSRIDELRVRGQLRSVTVTPKVGPRQSYEIITDQGGRDVSEGPSSARGAGGQRVWRVLAF